MSKLCPLFSGSQGNSYYIGANGKGILVDIGRTAKQMESALLSNEIDIKSIEGIFVTHEHSDHIKGLRVFANRYNLKVFASGGTLKALEQAGELKGSFIQPIVIESCGVAVADMQILPFATSHDSAESVGYTINMPDGRRVAVATDTGYLSKEAKATIMGSDVVVLESNHDVKMLLNGPYPYYLKRRILSDTGHLSNDACGEVLPELIKNGTTRLVLAHLSRENNVPEVALQNALCALQMAGMKQDKDYTIKVAPPVTDGKSIVF